ncbi:hypothetical protein ABZ470_38080 [Streptosporangium sp. NPDC020072]|uniref:hypothetical protein n=1 Tax=Streptosporangium sp. NPDC020072 TaxID=3154788 RepID=UPI00344266CA
MDEAHDRLRDAPRVVRASSPAGSEPGTVVRTGGPEPVLDGRLGRTFEAVGALSAEDGAGLIACATSRPRHVDLRRIVVLPARRP